MEKLILFAALSVPVIILSWHTLFNIKSHGFYRFLAWEGIIWLFVSNYKYWFADPFSIQHLFSWALLFISIYPVVAGTMLLRKKGRASALRKEKELYKWEKTSELIDTGIYKYIRHPLYSSLLFLAWGIFLKNVSAGLLIVILLITILLYLTAYFDEKECIVYFGDKYAGYMKKSKRFIPFIF